MNGFAIALSEHREVFTGLSELKSNLALAAAACVESIRSGGKIMFCGNGGFAANAQHFEAELVGRFVVELLPLLLNRQGYPVFQSVKPSAKTGACLAAF